MNEQDIREALEQALSGEMLEDTILSEIRMTRSFEEYGVLSSNEGLVLLMRNGGEFQITICRSR